MTKRIVGFCKSCRAPMYRTSWDSVVFCEHKSWCLEAKRTPQSAARMGQIDVAAVSADTDGLDTENGRTAKGESCP